MERRTRSQGFLIFATVAVSLFLIMKFFSSSTSSSPPTAPDKPDETGFRQRIVAFGDLHGDIVNAKKVLRMARIIDEHERWCAGSTILVQTGDIVDRGDHALQIYRLMQRLRGEAAAEGGKVISILGNHEMMQALGDWRYVSEGDLKEFGGMQARREAMSSDGWLGQEWESNYSVTAKVPYSPFPNAPALSFTHGSLKPDLPILLPYPDKLNELSNSLLRKALKQASPPYPPYPYQGLPEDATGEETELYSGAGPLWWRGLADGSTDVVCKLAKELTEKTGCRRIIGGHTPNWSSIVSRCDATVIIIDTAISSAYGGIRSALEIVYTLTPVPDDDDDDDGHREEPLMGESRGNDNPNGDGPDSQSPVQAPMMIGGKPVRSGSKWIETEVVTALYDHKSEVLAREVRQVVM